MTIIMVAVLGRGLSLFRKYLTNPKILIRVNLLNSLIDNLLFVKVKQEFGRMGRI